MSLGKQISVSEILMRTHILRVAFLLYIGGTLASTPAPNRTVLYVGTALFTSADVARECWTAERVALLTTRYLVTSLMPSADALKISDDQEVSDFIEYVRLLLEVIRAQAGGKAKHILLLAITDTLGGYMKFLILPHAKYAYYAGTVNYASVTKLYQLYDEVRNYLGTSGKTWAKAHRIGRGGARAQPISLTAPAPTTDPCRGLIYYRAGKHDPQNRHVPSDHCTIRIPLPFFDSKTHPTAIAVPFKTFGLRNLESRVAAYILVKYYVAGSRCLMSRDATSVDVKRFNTNVYAFVIHKVLPHLCDERFYAAFGGVLRIIETIKQTGTHSANELAFMPNLPGNEPYPNLGEEDDQTDDERVLAKHEKQHQQKQGGAGESKAQSKNNLIIIAALCTIIVWFCLGAAFVCCRIRASRNKQNERSGPIEMRSSLESHASASSTKPSHSTIQYPTAIKEQDENCVDMCREETCPAYAKPETLQIKKSTSLSRSQRRIVNEVDDDDDNVETTFEARKSHSFVKSGGTHSTHSTRTTTEPADSESIAQRQQKTSTPAVAQLDVRNVQYYPPSFACHTSITGKTRIESSTTSGDDMTNKQRMVLSREQQQQQQPYVFGYDFQTTSDEESSPRGDISDGDHDLNGNRSK